MVELDVSIVTRNRDPVFLGDGESIDRRVRSDCRQRRSHILQIPHSDRPVVGTRNHFVSPGENGRRHGLGVTLFFFED